MTDKTNPQERPLAWMSKSTVKGLVAFVVGGGSGIGEYAAKAFAANGGLVVVADRHGDAAQRVADEIKGQGGQAINVQADISSQEEIDASVAKAIDAYGRLDVLINTAGVIRPAELEDCSMDEWRNSFLINVDAALLMARACLPHLRKSPAAAIVNVSSLAGGRGYANGGAYGPSKAALVSLSRQMALEWAADGIRVNCVSPGTIDTPLTRANMREDIIASRETRIPQGRLGTPGEVGDLIVFLASPVASYITAQDINCDGGLSQALMFQKFYANR